MHLSIEAIVILGEMLPDIEIVMMRRVKNTINEAWHRFGKGRAVGHFGRRVAGCFEGRAAGAIHGNVQV